MTTIGTRRKYLATAGGVITAGLAGCVDSLTSGGDEYPTQSIEIQIPFPEGGGTDLETRVLADTLEETLDASIAPTNEPEAGGAVLYQQMTGEDADGYTLATFFFPLTHTHPEVIDGFDYDPDAFTYLAQYSQNTFNIMTGYDSEIETFEDVIEKGQEEPVSIAFTGPVAPVAIPILQIQEELDIEMEPVFVGGGENLAIEAQAGRVDLAANTFGTTMNNLAEQRTKPVTILSEPDEDLIAFYEDNLGVTVSSDQFITETDVLDNPPTLTAVRGVMGPPELPDDVQETLEDAIMEAMSDETDWREQMIDLGSFPTPARGDELQENIDDLRDEIDPYIPLLQDFAAEHG